MDKKNLLTILAVVLLVWMGFQFFFKAPEIVPIRADRALPLPDHLQPFAPQDGWPAPETRTLGNPDIHGGYKLGLQISNVNAGIDWVKTADYAQEVNKPERMTLMSSSDIALRPFATTKIMISYNDDKGIQHNDLLPFTRVDNDKILATWEFVPPTRKDEVRLRLWYLGDKAHPQIEIFKVFRLKDPASYEVEVSHEVANHMDRDIRVTIDQAGPVNMPRDSVQTDARLFQAAAFISSSSSIKSDQRMIPQTSFTARGFFSKERLSSQEVGSFTATVDPDWVAHADKIFSEDAAHFHKTSTDPAGSPAAKAAADAEQERIKKLRADAHDLVWVAESNRFFTVITRPVPMGLDTPRIATLAIKKPIDQTSAFGIVSAEVIVPTAAPDWESRPDKWVTGVAIYGLPVTVPAAAAAEPKVVGLLNVYMGPKDRVLLRGDPTAPAGTQAGDYFDYDYLGVLSFSRGACSFCAFPSVAIFILGVLDAIHKVTFHNYGIAIMVLVIVVRLLMHPLTRYSQVNMAKMQNKMKTVQPELDRLKKKYGKEKQKYNEEMMKLYKEKNINPAGGILGCLPMLLQMPIWAALYAGLAADIDLRHAGFIPGWINDLSNPDTLIKFHDPVSIPVLSSLMGPLNGLNLLPILLAIVFFVNAKMQQKTMPKPQDETQAKTQAMTQYTTLLFPLFLYLAPSGLNLYIFASTIGGIFDTYLVRRHLRATGILPAAGALAKT